MTNKFLLEILTEDMPPSLQLSAADFIKDYFKNHFLEADISFNKLEVYHTPRRLIVYIEGLPLVVKEQGLEKKGPLKDAPKTAVDGFLKSCGSYKEHEITFKEIKGKLYYFFKQSDKELEVAKKLKTLTLDALSAVKFKRSMFWNESNVYWGRPIRNIVAMFNTSFLSFEFAGVESCNFTFAHMFLQNNKKLEFNTIENYFTELAENNVMYNQYERVDYIIKTYNEIAIKRGFATLSEESDNENIQRVLKLIKTEVTYLIEYPFLLELDYSSDYTEVLPADLIVETIEKNQKYLATFSKNNKELVSTFIIVSNNFIEDNYIVEGNLKVVDARLKDALFFYNDDIAKKPEYFYSKLSEIDFFKGLGSYKDKTERELAIIKNLMFMIENGYSFSKLQNTLKYLKIDIASSTVQELPEFQGTFSKYYLPYHDVKDDIADAIASQYKPLGNEDALPKSDLAIIIALAVKIETLLSFFAIGKNTTGSGDVLGLRRNALGIVRIILNSGLDIDLNVLFAHYDKYANIKVLNEEYLLNFKNFISQRLYYYLKQQNHKHYLLKASFAYLETSKRFSLLEGYNNLRCLEKLEEDGKLKEIIAIYKRLYNISKASEIENGFSLNKNLLQDDHEILLFEFLENVTYKQDSLEILEAIYENSSLFHNFFDNVVVNDSNLSVRSNRLLLVKTFVEKMQNIANLHEIVG